MTRRDGEESEQNGRQGGIKREKPQADTRNVKIEESLDKERQISEKKKERRWQSWSAS